MRACPRHVLLPHWEGAHGNLDKSTGRREEQEVIIFVSDYDIHICKVSISMGPLSCTGRNGLAAVSHLQVHTRPPMATSQAILQPGLNRFNQCVCVCLSQGIRESCLPVCQSCQLVWVDKKEKEKKRNHPDFQYSVAIHPDWYTFFRVHQ